MLRIVVLSVVIVGTYAGGLGLAAGGLGLGAGGYGLGAGGYGLGAGGLALGAGGLGLGATGLGLGATGLGLGVGKGAALGGSVGLVGGGLGIGTGIALPGPIAVPAAIASKRTYEVKPVLLPQEPAVPSIINVEPSEQPVQVVFRSVSSPVLVQQIHTPGAPGQVEATKSEDEPHRVLHEVLRPVIQEVREIIQPYRRVVQEVRPVLEEVHTVVAKGEGRVPAAVGAVGPIAANIGPVGPIGLGDAGGYAYGGELLVGGAELGPLGGGALGLGKKGYKSGARKA